MIDQKPKPQSAKIALKALSAMNCAAEARAILPTLLSRCSIAACMLHKGRSRLINPISAIGSASSGLPNTIATGIASEAWMNASATQTIQNSQEALRARSSASSGAARTTAASSPLRVNSTINSLVVMMIAAAP